MISGNSTKGLLLLYSQILRELKVRGIARTANNPVGDLAETLFVKAFNLTFVTGSNKGYDATDKESLKYQIKGRRITQDNPSRQLSQIRDLDSSHFDFLAGVIFDEDFRLIRACVLPIATVRLLAKKQEWVNAWRIDLRDNLWKRPEVRDVTRELQIEYEKL